MISGKVVHGQKVGRKLNYPTANISVPPDGVMLKDGIYAGRALLDGKKYGAAVIINKKMNKFEAHLLDYSGPDFYGKFLEVEIFCKVSEFKKLNQERLKEKIISDMVLIRKIIMKRGIL